jgi:hypothetical protein
VLLHHLKIVSAPSIGFHNKTEENLWYSILPPISCHPSALCFKPNAMSATRISYAECEKNLAFAFFSTIFSGRHLILPVSVLATCGDIRSTEKPLQLTSFG